MSDLESKTPIPYFLASAFTDTDDPFAGNPAVTLLLENGTPPLPRSTLLKIAQNFNQPMLSVLSGPKPKPNANTDGDADPDPSVAKFDVEWFTPFMSESPLCGHATIALTRSIFDAEPRIVGRDVTKLELRTNRMGVVSATLRDGGWIEISLRAAPMEEVEEGEKAELNALFDKAVGRRVKINTVVKGVQGFEHYALVVVDDTEKIADWEVDANALLPSGYAIHIVTTASKGPETYITRMFSPKFCLGGEDHVCGSANSLLAPYWARQKNIAKGEEMDVWSASKRGGRFKAVWNGETVTLRGKASVWAAGKLVI